MVHSAIRTSLAASTTFGLWLRAAAEKHYTVMGVFTMAVIGLGLGLALTLDGEAVGRSPSLRLAFDLARPAAWGIACFAVAGLLIIYGLLSLHNTRLLRRTVPILILGGTMLCFFAVLIAETVPDGGGVALGVVLFAGLGVVFYFVALGAYFAGRRI